MNIPKLRFNGFNDEWKCKILKDIANVKTGGTPSTKVYDYWNPNEIDWMASGEVNKRYIFNTDKKISKKGLQQSSTKLVKSNSVLIALAGQGKTRAKVAINKKEIAINQSLAAIELNDNYNYLFVFFNLDKRYLELRKLSSGDSGRGGLNKKLVSDIKINIPDNIQEQQKIGALFAKLDNLINLQVKKLELLKQLKQGLLQRLFPQNNQTTPQLRFKGFNDKWEIKSLRTFLQIPNKEKVINIDKNKLLTVSLHTKGVHVNTNTDTLKLGKTTYYYRHAGQFIYGKQNLFNGAMAIIPSEYDNFYTSGDVPSLEFKNNNVCSNYIYRFLSRPNFYKKLAVLANGSGSKRIHEDVFLNVDIIIPSLEEQQKISSLLTNLDKLLTKTQEKITLFKQVKKYLLQRMFI